MGVFDDVEPSRVFDTLLVSVASNTISSTIIAFLFSNYRALFRFSSLKLLGPFVVADTIAVPNSSGRFSVQKVPHSSTQTVRDQSFSVIIFP